MVEILFVYDVRENIRGVKSTQGVVRAELLSELFSASEANSIVRALKALGHDIEVVDGADAFRDQIDQYRHRQLFVFNEAKGLFGPDRKMLIPALCRVYGIPYLGSDAYAVTLARNKWHTAAIASALGLDVPRSVLVERSNDRRLAAWTTFPAIVKPNHESSSIGISTRSVVSSGTALKTMVDEVVQTYRQPVLVEEFICGQEIQVSIVGNDGSCTIRVVQVLVEGREADPYFLVRREDWSANRVYFKRLEEGVEVARAKRAALEIYKALGVQDYGRIDFRVSTRGMPIFIEAATHPHLVPRSSFVEALAEDADSFAGVLELVLRASFRRQGLS